MCATQRCIRLQPLEGPLPPGLSAHFRLFALVTAGHDSGENRFEAEALLEHVACYLRLLRAARDAGFRISGAAVEISDTEAVLAVLGALGIDVVEVRRTARAHRVGAAATALERRGASLPPPAADPERILESVGASVERSLTSAIGSEHLCRLYAP